MKKISRAPHLVSYTRTYACTHDWVSVCMHVCTHACTHACTHSGASHDGLTLNDNNDNEIQWGFLECPTSFCMHGHTDTHTHSYSITHWHSHTHTHTLLLNHSLTFTHTHTHTHLLNHSLTFTHTRRKVEVRSTWIFFKAMFSRFVARQNLATTLLTASNVVVVLQGLG